MGIPNLRIVCFRRFRVKRPLHLVSGTVITDADLVVALAIGASLSKGLGLGVEFFQNSQLLKGQKHIRPQ